MAEGFIDDELATFLEDGNSFVVATRDAALVPSATRACGIGAIGSDRVFVLLPRATSARVIRNLEENGSIAVCVSSVLTFRTVQLKGRAISIESMTAEDLMTSEEQLRRLADAAAKFGASRKQVRNLWLFDSWRVTVLVTAAYSQTPGPGAGAPLDQTRGR